MSSPDSFAQMACSTARRAVPVKSWGVPSRFGSLLERVDMTHSLTNAAAFFFEASDFQTDPLPTTTSC